MAVAVGEGVYIARHVWQVRESAAVTRIYYDARGNVVAMEDSRGPAASPFRYDAEGKLNQIEESTGE